MTEHDRTEPDAAPVVLDAEQARTEELRLGPFMTEPLGSRVTPGDQSTAAPHKTDAPAREAKSQAKTDTPPAAEKKVDPWTFGVHELPMALSAELIGAKVPLIPEADLYHSPQLPKQAGNSGERLGADTEVPPASRRNRARQLAAYGLLFGLLLVAAAALLLREPHAVRSTPPRLSGPVVATTTPVAKSLPTSLDPAAWPEDGPGGTSRPPSAPAQEPAGTKPDHGPPRKRPRLSTPAAVPAEPIAPDQKPAAHPFDRIPPQPPE